MLLANMITIYEYYYYYCNVVPDIFFVALAQSLLSRLVQQVGRGHFGRVFYFLVHPRDIFSRLIDDECVDGILFNSVVS